MDTSPARPAPDAIGSPDETPALSGETSKRIAGWQRLAEQARAEAETARREADELAERLSAYERDQRLRELAAEHPDAYTVLLQERGEVRPDDGPTLEIIAAAMTRQAEERIPRVDMNSPRRRPASPEPQTSREWLDRLAAFPREAYGSDT